MIMQAAFFKVADIIPIDDAVKYLKDAVVKSYGKKGQKVVDMNYAAIDRGVASIHKVTVPDSWKDSTDGSAAAEQEYPEFYKKVVIPMNRQEGDDLPVSAFKGYEDGRWPLGITGYEKRGVAVRTAKWNSDNCIQCNQCSFVCPHAVIRPMLATAEESPTLPRASRPCRPRETRKNSSIWPFPPWTAPAAACAYRPVLPRKRPWK